MKLFLFLFFIFIYLFSGSNCKATGPAWTPGYFQGPAGPLVAQMPPPWANYAPAILVDDYDPNQFQTEDPEPVDNEEDNSPPWAKYASAKYEKPTKSPSFKKKTPPTEFPKSKKKPLESAPLKKKMKKPTKSKAGKKGKGKSGRGTILGGDDYFISPWDKVEFLTELLKKSILAAISNPETVPPSLRGKVNVFTTISVAVSPIIGTAEEPTKPEVQSSPASPVSVNPVSLSTPQALNKAKAPIKTEETESQVSLLKSLIVSCLKSKIPANPPGPIELTTSAPPALNPVQIVKALAAKVMLAKKLGRKGQTLGSGKSPTWYYDH